MCKSTALFVFGAGLAWTQSNNATNVILFIGDGVSVSSLSAASIYGYNKPQAFVPVLLALL